MAKSKKVNKPKKSNALDKLILIFVMTAVIVFPVGYIVGNAATEVDMPVNEVSNAEVPAGEINHAHPSLEIGELADLPSVIDLAVTKDLKAGWNVSFDTVNFKFTPENASGDHIANEGHAHIYVDGVKITRLYSNNYYLGELSEGKHEVRVTLNTNDHKDYTVNGATIEALFTVNDDHHADDEQITEHAH